LLSFIPTTILLAYFHGKPGKDEWTKVEKIGIPFNVLFSIFLLVFLFNGKELGSITQTVTAENEEGQTIERVIPKSEFRKNIGVFFFENATQDSTLDWMQYALSYMIDYDLSQDMFLNVKNGYELYSYFKYSNVPGNTKLPLAQNIKITKKNYCNYFLKGIFSFESDSYFVKTTLYQISNGKLLEERKYYSSDIFSIVDEISNDIKQDLNIYLQSNLDNSDLPISDTFTNSIDALESYFNSFEFNIWGSVSTDNKLLDLAIKKDSTFVEAYLTYIDKMLPTINSFEVSMINNTPFLKIIYNKVNNYFSELLEHINKLPDSQQFYIKTIFYDYKREDDNTEFILSLWSNLYPDDVRYYQFLADRHLRRGEIVQSIEVFKDILELDPSRYNILLKIGDIYKEQNDLTNSQKYYELYLTEFPTDFESYIKLADIYSTNGNYKSAKELLSNAIAMKHDNYRVLLELGYIEAKMGNFVDALGYYIEYSKHPSNMSSYYGALADLYLQQGQYENYLNYLIKEWKSLNFSDSIKTMLPRYSFDPYGYLIRLNKYNPDTLFTQNLYNDCFIIDELFRIDRVSDDQVYRVEAVINSYDKLTRSIDTYNGIVLPTKGLLLEINKNYLEAIKIYLEVIEYLPRSNSILRRISSSYRKLGKYAKAEEYIKQSLRYLPASGFSHYEYALLFHDMGKKKKAIEELNKALEIWKDADPEFIPAQMARDKLLELEL